MTSAVLAVPATGAVPAMALIVTEMG